MTRPGRADRILFGAAMGAAMAVLTYALVRGVERAFFPEPNPVLVIWSERSPLVWRAVIALYLGGAGVFGGHALAARAPRVAARWAGPAIAIAAVAIVVQTVLWP